MQSARLNATRIVFFCSDLDTDTRYSYAAFDQETDRMAGAGGVAVPVNTAYTGREVAYILNDSGSRMVITKAAFRTLPERVRASVPSLERIIMKAEGEPLIRCLERKCGVLKLDLSEGGTADDLAFIFYTSGTTWSPKGVMLTNGTWFSEGATQPRTTDCGRRT